MKVPREVILNQGWTRRNGGSDVIVTYSERTAILEIQISQNLARLWGGCPLINARNGKGKEIV